MVVLLPAAAAAGTLYSGPSSSETDARYYAAPGEVNHVVVSTDGSTATFTDAAGATPPPVNPFFPLTPVSNCTQVNPTTLNCPNFRTLHVWLGNQNDTFSWGGGAFASSNATQPLDVIGGGGSDNISGSPFADILDGAGSNTEGDLPVADPGGNDVINGNAGDDTISDGDGASNTLDGGVGSDRIDSFGTNGMPATAANTILGGPGDDFINGGDGPDLIVGGDDNDAANGGGGADSILGEGGKDELEGGGDQDVVDGGPGNDILEKLFHGGGCTLAPKLDGGPDTLIGGPGQDGFDVSCNTPILKLRDGEADKVHCAPRVDSAVKEYDKKIDLAEGGACATLVCKTKGKAGKKGKKSSLAVAAKKGKKKKKKCKPFKFPN